MGLGQFTVLDMDREAEHPVAKLQVLEVPGGKTMPKLQGMHATMISEMAEASNDLYKFYEQPKDGQHAKLCWKFRYKCNFFLLKQQFPLKIKVEFLDRNRVTMVGMGRGPQREPAMGDVLVKFSRPRGDTGTNMQQLSHKIVDLAKDLAFRAIIQDLKNPPFHYHKKENRSQTTKLSRLLAIKSFFGLSFFWIKAFTQIFHDFKLDFKLYVIG